MTSSAKEKTRISTTRNTSKFIIQLNAQRVSHQTRFPSIYCLHSIPNNLCYCRKLKNDGSFKKVSAATLQVGDIIKVYQNERVPADLVLL